MQKKNGNSCNAKKKRKKSGVAMPYYV